MMHSIQWQQALCSYQPGKGLLATPSWQNSTLSVRLDNISGHAMSLDTWSLFEGQVASADTPIYGEGFQMLAQTAGSWGAPEAVGRCPDAAVYRITQDDGFHTVHNLLLYKAGEEWQLLAFTGCERFGGEFRLYPDGRLQILLRTEGMSLPSGGHWQSEPLLVLRGADRQALLDDLAQHLERHHPASLPATSPTGWCSWYHYYAEVTAADIGENLALMESSFPELEYVQIDDGYQAFMGDWLSASARFTGGLLPLLEQIRAAGREPALWVAPFIAETASALFQSHPEWFVKDESGHPLAAERVTYGGWRCTPWYMLDGTHPQVQAHLRQLFTTLRHELGIRYFKLDANFWGAVHGGRFHDPAASRIQAYRRGMQAILDGVGEDSYLLGCNAPIWPSLGLVQGMRLADDIERTGHRIRQTARELFYRSWQAGKLWLLDPDCLCLRDLPGQQASAAEYRFHLAALLASGGVLLLGDRLSLLDEAQRALLAPLLQRARSHHQPARFTDDAFGHAISQEGGKTLHFYFNWHNSELILDAVPAGCDFFSAEPIPAGKRVLAPYDALVLVSA